ncbi:DUF6928 family protein [Streptomyces sp. NPDC056194]|uniref:DUF6928 family protein n=1 Tax=unclassified Streptomyces TaxID=2593676 RepID=UPI0035E21651
MEASRTRRCRSRSPDDGIMESIGDPFAFETPYWSGDRPAAFAPEWGERLTRPSRRHPPGIG